MPIYNFICNDDECGNQQEYWESIKNGPPKNVICSKCGSTMYQELQCNFELKGDGWPGKDIKSDTQMGQAAEKAEEFLSKEDDKQKENKEVLSKRRLGRRKFAEWSQHNKPKVDRYMKRRSPTKNV